VIARFAALLHGAVGAVGRRHVRLVADDRINAGVLALLVEFDRAEEVAVIGHRDRVHAERLGMRDQFRHPVGAIEEAIVRVAMQVNEGTLGHDRAHP
jgi:hypothetical protein